MRSLQAIIIMSKANWKRYLPWMVLIAAGALIAALEVWVLQRPGTMDACYSYVEGNMLAAGKGWLEPFIWNYLDDPIGLPHPAFLYWMPLPAILSSFGVFFAGESFRNAQIGFWFVVTLFPAFVFWLARRWSLSGWVAWMAAIFAMFPGFYAVYAGTTDGFFIFAGLGGGILALIAETPLIPRRIWILGALCGLAHLTRADGILFLGLVFLWLLLDRSQSIGARLRSLLFLLAGYGTVAGVWFIRNLTLLHSLFAPAAGRAIWIQEYNQLFHFPAADLTPAWWLSTGWQTWMTVRWDGLLWNLQTTFFVLGLVFFGPFIAIGIYRLRKESFLRFGVAYYALLFFVMTIVFPLQGSRGGLFHSSAAMLPLACICAAAGLDFSIRWVAARRAWRLPEAHAILGAGIALITIVMTIAIIRSRVSEGVLGAGQGGNKQTVFQQAAQWITAKGEAESIVMVGDPPCYYAETNRAAIVIPEGGALEVLMAADRYHARYILIDRDVPPAMLPLYQGQAAFPRFKWLATFSVGESSSPTYLYLILPESDVANEP
jgi:hypothetical protein